MEHQALKKQLFMACQDHINNRISAIEQRLLSIEESRNDETKSSVGDKYETGRAMMQMEEEKTKMQLSEAHMVRNALSKINPDKSFEKIEPGSLVKTNKGVYFLSIGIGKLTLDHQLYYCISHQSPIGSLLLNKKTGDECLFNGTKMTIEAVY